MIQATPNTEPVSQAQCPQDTPKTDQQKTSKAEKSGLGVFAKILAGLTDRGAIRKTGAGDRAAHTAVSEIPITETAESGELNAEQAGKLKKSLVKKVFSDAVDKNGTGKPEKTGLGTEIAESELSEQEKSILFSLGGLVNRNEAQITVEDVDLSDEAGSAGLSLAGAEEAGHAAASLKSALERSANDVPEQLRPEETTASVAAASSETAQDVGQKAKLNDEKTKNSRFSAEIQDNGARTTSQITDEGLVRQVETKNTAGTEKRGRLEEVRNREKRRGVNFEVGDFRNSGIQTETVTKEGPFRVSGIESRVSGQTEKEITLELRLPQGRESTPAAASAVTSWEANSGRAMENFLARELHQNFNNDIVRHASVILREKNEGIIRLALKPESLGNVKIHLEMAENKITGRIVVETEEVLRAFEREVSSLEKAFRDSGFEGASLEMSLASDGGADQGWQEAEASRFSQGMIASRYEAAFDRVEMPAAFDVYQWGTQAVNMLA